MKKASSNAPVISEVYPQNGQVVNKAGYNYFYASANVVDDSGSTWQVIFQIDPVGDTVPAPSPQDKALYSVVVMEMGRTSYDATIPFSKVGVGSHKLRVTAFDRDRNKSTVETTFTVQ